MKLKQVRVDLPNYDALRHIKTHLKPERSLEAIANNAMEIGIIAMWKARTSFISTSTKPKKGK